MKKNICICGLLFLFTLSCTKTYTKSDFVYEGINKGNIELIRACIDQGFDIYETDSLSGDSYLMDAARSGYPEVVKLFLDRGLDPNHLSHDYDEPENNKKKKGIFFRSRPSSFLIDRQRASVLFNGIKYPAITKILLERGADPNALLGEGFSTIMIAINLLSDINYRESRTDILESMRLLLEYGADPSYHGEEETGISPLLLALNYKLRDAADLLLEYGAQPTERMAKVMLPEHEERRRKYNIRQEVFWQSELHLFAWNGYADLLMPYIQSGKIKPANRTPDGIDYFYFAAEGGSPGMLMALLPYVRNINAPRYSFKGLRNMTLIFVAGYHENLEAVKVLLENGADPNIKAYSLDNPSEWYMPLQTDWSVLHTINEYERGWLHFPEYKIR
jgi:ankyrin repeat protein